MIYKKFHNVFSAIFSLTIFAALLSVNPLQTLASSGGHDPTFSGDGKADVARFRLFARQPINPKSFEVLGKNPLPKSIEIYPIR